MSQNNYKEKLLKAYEDLNKRLQDRSKEIAQGKQNETIFNPSHKVQIGSERDRSVNRDY